MHDIKFIRKNPEKFEKQMHRRGLNMDVSSILEIDAIIRKYNLKKIDFLKLDIEGYEFRALQGASNSMLKGIIKFIQLEYQHRYLLQHTSLCRNFHS